MAMKIKAKGVVFIPWCSSFRRQFVCRDNLRGKQQVTRIKYFAHCPIIYDGTFRLADLKSNVS